MSRLWKYFLLGYLVALPCTLLGLIAAPFYGAHSWRWSDGCLEAIAPRIWGRPAAQTLGWIIFYADEGYRARVDFRVHERVHVVQAFLVQLVAVVTIGAWALFAQWPWWADAPYLAFASLPFTFGYALLHFALFFTHGRDWYAAYRNNPFEVQAYARERDAGMWGTRP